MSVCHITLTSCSRDEGIAERKFSLDPISAPSIDIGRSSKRSSGRGPPAVSNAIYSSPVISRHHARLFVHDDQNSVFIQDLESLHGTTVNFTPLDPDVERHLSPGDIITLGEVKSNLRDAFMRRFEIKYHWEAKPVSATRSSSVEIIEHLPEDTRRSVDEPANTPNSTTSLRVFQVPDLSSSDSEVDDCHEGYSKNRTPPKKTSEAAELASCISSSSQEVVLSDDDFAKLLTSETRSSKTTTRPDSSSYLAEHGSSPIQPNAQIDKCEDELRNVSSNDSGWQERRSIKFKAPASPRLSPITSNGTESRPIQVDDEVLSDGESAHKSSSSSHFYDDECAYCGDPTDATSHNVFECDVCGAAHHTSCADLGAAIDASKMVCALCGAGESSDDENSISQQETGFVDDVHSITQNSKPMIVESNEKTVTTNPFVRVAPNLEEHPTSASCAGRDDVLPIVIHSVTQDPEPYLGPPAQPNKTMSHPNNAPRNFRKSADSVGSVLYDGPMYPTRYASMQNCTFNNPSYCTPYVNYGQYATLDPSSSFAPPFAEGSTFNQRPWTRPALYEDTEQVRDQPFYKLHPTSPSLDELQDPAHFFADKSLPSFRHAVSNFNANDIGNTTLPGLFSQPDTIGLDTGYQDFLPSSPVPAVHSTSRVAIGNLVTPSPSTPQSRKSPPSREQTTMNVGNKRKADQMSDSSGLDGSAPEMETESAAQPPVKKVRLNPTVRAAPMEVRLNRSNSRFSSSSFMLGALAGGIGLLGALVALPESMFN